MLNTLMNALGFSSGQDDGEDFSARRVYPRRPQDKCVGVIDGTMMPVVDWSLGGVRVFADPRTIQIGREMDVELKFQIQDELVKVSHRGQVVRKAADSFALQFLPLTADIRTAFNHIIDSFNAEEFAASQA